MQMRPAQFELDYSHPLARGLVFAELGQSIASAISQDVSPYRNSVAFIAGPTTTTINGRYARIYTEASAQYADIGRELVLSDYTVSCWLHITSFVYYDTLFGMGTSDNGDGALCRIDTSNGSVSVRVDNTSIQVSSSSVLAAGNTYHVVVTRQANSLKSYVDGVDVTSGTPSDDRAAYFQYLGATQASGIERTLDGALADALVYDRALPASEIAELADSSNVMLSGMIKPVGSLDAALSPYNLEGVR